MTYKEIIDRTAKKLNLPEDLVDRTYKAYWRSIREHIESLPLKDDLTDEEFMNLQPNVNIPSIGKLYVTLDRYKAIKRMYKLSKQKKDAAHKESQANVHLHYHYR